MGNGTGGFLCGRVGKSLTHCDSAAEIILAGSAEARVDKKEIELLFLEVGICNTHPHLIAETIDGASTRPRMQ